MWGFKKKKKLDPRVRFQHESFTRKLDRQKRFQRRARPIPEGDFGKFLAAIGLESATSRLAVLACLLALAYIVYIPNFLFIQDVEISGMSDADAATLHQNVDQFFRSSLVPFPQKNLLFLSKRKLSFYITEHNQHVWKVDRIQKKPFNHLVIQLQAKQERYVVSTPDGAFIIFNDGTAARKIDSDATKPENQPLSGLIKLVVDSISSPAIGEAILSTGVAGKLQQLADYFSAQIQRPISYISLAASNQEVVTPAAETVDAPTAVAAATSGANHTAAGTSSLNSALQTPVEHAKATLPLDPQEFYVYTPRKSDGRDFRILFDTRGDFAAALTQLKLLLGTLGSDKMANLVYVDLRLSDRAYVCMINTACVLTNNPSSNPSPNPRPNAP